MTFAVLWAAITASAQQSPPSEDALRGTSRLPREGDHWTYRLFEPKRIDGPKETTYAVTVIAASQTAVTERFSIGQGPSSEWTHKGEPALMPLGKQLLAPYLLAFTNLPPGRMAPRNLPIFDPACTGAYVCEAIGSVVAWETIKVPAGTFNTIKVEVRENWRPGSQMSGQFGAQNQGGRILHIWYAYETRRAVKFVSRPTFGSLPPIDTDFEMELVSYQLK